MSQNIVKWNDDEFTVPEFLHGYESAIWLPG